MANIDSKTLPMGVQLLATAGLCAVCFYAGGKLSGTTPNGKFLVADKNSVIVAAVMERNSTDAKQLDAEITQPVLTVMRRYTDQGYVIIDGGKDERGNLTVAALPPGTRDITDELAAAVARKDGGK
jgi:hypothetical protein